MLPMPWQMTATAQPGKEYVALLSYLPVNTYWAIPRLMKFSLETIGQLKKTPGVIGYSLAAELTRRTFWTLSAWQDQQSLMDFVEAIPHSEIMKKLIPYMGKTKFEQWTVTADKLPLQWNDAVKRIAS
jgi:hypothetical protein